MSLPETSAAPAPRTYQLWGWLNLAGVIAFTMGATVLVLLGGRLVAIATNTTASMGGILSPAAYLTTAGIYLSSVLGIYLFVARRYGWQALGWRRVSARTLLLVPLILLLAATGMALVNLAITLVVGEFENPQVMALTGGQPFGMVGLIALLLLVAGLVPLAEELFFRGLLYGMLRERWGLLPAVLLSALLFAVAHFVPVLFPALFVMGLVLALLREYTGSLIPCIVLHSMQNGLALIAIQTVLLNS